MTTENYIAIQEPCYIGWENMTHSEKGKFCASCKKHVHDFTNSSVDEIKKTFTENNGTICGHLPVKLIREQYVISQTKKEYFNYLKTFCIAAIFCFGSSLFTINTAKAGVLQNLKRSFFSSFSDTNNDTIPISGFVKDRNTHEVIPFAIISVISNDVVVSQTTTNAEGAYEIKLIKNKFSKIDIKATYIGYDSHIMKNIIVDTAKKIIVDIDLKQSELYMEGIIIIQSDVIKIENFSSGRTINQEDFKHIPK